MFWAINTRLLQYNSLVKSTIGKAEGICSYTESLQGLYCCIVTKVDKAYTITSDDFTFLQASLSSLGETTQTKEESPCILIKVNNNIYSIGVHNTFQNNNKTYSLSEEDTYRIKSIVHFYDYIDEDNLEELKEIKQFGIPHNYDYCPSNPQKPTKQFIKLMLIEEK